LLVTICLICIGKDKIQVVPQFIAPLTHGVPVLPPSTQCYLSDNLFVLQGISEEPRILGTRQQSIKQVEIPELAEDTRYWGLGELGGKAKLVEAMKEEAFFTLVVVFCTLGQDCPGLEELRIV